MVVNIYFELSCTYLSMLIKIEISGSEGSIDFQDKFTGGSCNYGGKRNESVLGP